MNNATEPKARPFPWKCVHCGQRTVRPETMTYKTEIIHDGRAYAVTVPDLRTPCCENADCRAIVLDGDANHRITQAFRRKAGLLEPGEIRRRREGLRLTQAALAERLGVGPATLSRWETGAQIQQRSLDKLLRLFFDLPEVRQRLAPPVSRRYRCLQVTDELRHRAKEFQLTFPYRRCGDNQSAESEAAVAESLAASGNG